MDFTGIRSDDNVFLCPFSFEQRNKNSKMFKILVIVSITTQVGHIRTFHPTMASADIALLSSLISKWNVKIGLRVNSDADVALA